MLENIYLKNDESGHSYVKEFLESEFDVTIDVEYGKITGRIWDYEFNNDNISLSGYGSPIANIDRENKFLRIGNLMNLINGNVYGSGWMDAQYIFGDLVYMTTTNNEPLVLCRNSNTWETHPDISMPPFSADSNAGSFVNNNVSNVIYTGTNVIPDNSIYLLPLFIGRRMIKNVYTSGDLVQIGKTAKAGSQEFQCLARGIYYKL